MRVQKLFVLCFGMLIILTGCKGATNPTVPNVSDQRAMQGLPTKPSDDTSDSEIVSPQYPEGTTVIVAIGDSITYGKGTWNGGYPANLEAKLRTAGYNVVVLNEGILGEASPETNERFLSVIAGVDIVLLMIGTNDVINPGNRYVDTIGNIAAMLDKALISKIVPVVSTVPPGRPDSDYEWINGRLWYLNADIYDVATQRNVVVVDNYNAILNNGGKSLYVDPIHFNDRGNAVLADQWYNALVGNNLVTLPQE